MKAEDNVSSGDVIRVVRIRTEEITENEAVAYSTVYEDTEELYEGETETKTEGVEGEAKLPTRSRMRTARKKTASSRRKKF